MLQIFCHARMGDLQANYEWRISINFQISYGKRWKKYYVICEISVVWLSIHQNIKSFTVLTRTLFSEIAVFNFFDTDFLT